MPDKLHHVGPIRTRSKTEVSGALAAGWARISANRKGAFADNLGIDVKTVNRALTGETLPELHTALNSLADDPTALDAGEVQQAVQRARHPNSPGGTAIVPQERAEIMPLVQKAAASSRKAARKVKS